METKDITGNDQGDCSRIKQLKSEVLRENEQWEVKEFKGFKDLVRDKEFLGSAK
jgi:hypothetical protein